MAQILCFGDSITLGMVDLEGGWTQRLRRRLDESASFAVGGTTFPAHVVLNLGISDDTSAGVRARLLAEAQPRLVGQETVVVVAVGTNETAVDLDTGEPRHSLERFVDDLAELTAAARRLTERVLLVELPPCDEARMHPAPWSTDGESYANDRIRAFNAALAGVAADHGVPVAECFDALLAGDPRVLLHDGLHPNGDGHALLADRIGDRLAGWL